jgi:serine/threonine protein kinase
MKADRLVSRLLTVPREERARVLAQEGPASWDSVLFFAVRDGLRDARFHGQMSAADYVDTLEEVERRYEEGASATSTGRSMAASDDSEDQTIDLEPPPGDEDLEGPSKSTAPAERIEEPATREPLNVERRTSEEPVRHEPVIVERRASVEPIRHEPVIVERRASVEPIRQEPTIVERRPPDEPMRREPVIVERRMRREPVSVERRASADRSPPEPATARVAAEPATARVAAEPAPKVEFVIGATIRDRYVLQQQIGRGGSGIVFRARDIRRDALVALKVLREELRGEPLKIERLKREFQQAQALSHPNIIRVFDIDCEGDAWFLTMELLDGESLRSHLASQPKRLPQRNALAIILACADALDFAHEHGVVHGDFKPGNVLLGRDRQIRVVDFGEAASGAGSSSGSTWQASESHLASATPAYASPEVLRGVPPQVRDDVYSFACVAYEVLTRQHPFERHSALVARQRRMKLRRLKGLSRRQFAALKRGLAWSRSNRPANVRELADELRDSSPKRQPFGFWFALAAAAVGTFIAVTFLLDSDLKVPTTAPETTSRSDVADTTNRPSQQTARQDVAPPAPAPSAGGTRSTEQGASPSTTTPPGALLANQKAPAVRSEPSPLTNNAAPKAAAAPSSADLAATTAAIESQALSKGESVSDGAATIAAIQPQASSKGESLSAAAATTAVIRSQALSRAGSVSLQQANIVVSERATQAVVRIQRRDDLQGSVTVQWRTVPGTAQPGIDYSPMGSGSVSIPENQDIRVLYIPLIINEASKSNEWFDLELTGVTGGARLGPVTRTRITILDDH